MIEISNSKRRILVTTIFNFHVITGNLILIRLEGLGPSSTVNQGTLYQRFSRGFAARCRPPAGWSAFDRPRHLTKACRERTSGTQGTDMRARNSNLRSSYSLKGLSFFIIFFAFQFVSVSSIEVMQLFCNKQKNKCLQLAI